MVIEGIKTKKISFSNFFSEKTGEYIKDTVKGVFFCLMLTYPSEGNASWKLASQIEYCESPVLNNSTFYTCEDGTPYTSTMSRFGLGKALLTNTKREPVKCKCIKSGGKVFMLIEDKNDKK